MNRTYATIARVGLLALALTVLFSPSVCAAVGEQEAAQLGKSLTPVGAEKAANKDGTIPEWTGGLTTPPTGWKPGQKRVDPFAADKPLFSIDASNVDRYKDKLSEGQLALVKQLKGYRMDVYPTRRSCGFACVRLRALVDEDERTRSQARGQRLGTRERHRGGRAVPDSEDGRRSGLEPQSPLHGRGADRALRDDLLEQGSRGSGRRRNEAAERGRFTAGARGRADPGALVLQQRERRVAVLSGSAPRASRADVFLRQPGARL